MDTRPYYFLVLGEELGSLTSVTEVSRALVKPVFSQIGIYLPLKDLARLSLLNFCIRGLLYYVSVYTQCAIYRVAHAEILPNRGMIKQTQYFL